MSSVIICQECGKPMVHLYNHVQAKHNMTIQDYKDKHESPVRSDKMVQVHEENRS